MNDAMRAMGLRLAILGFVAISGGTVTADVLHEDFDDGVIEPALWTVTAYGSGPEMTAANRQLEVVMPENSGGGDFGVKLASTFRLHGDFDIQVCFHLYTWPFGNGVRMGLGTDSD